MKKNSSKAHILLFPYPRQGHINPILQFAKILTRKGLTTTLITTTSIHFPSYLQNIAVETIFDGFSDAASREAAVFQAFFNLFCSIGPTSLAKLLNNYRSKKQRCCLVYDSMLPWARRVAADQGMKSAVFLTQPCCVNLVYYCAARGLVELPLSTRDNWQLLPAAVLPEMKMEDLPSFVADPEYSSDHLKLVLQQFDGIEMADFVFCSTVQEMERKEINWLSKFFLVKAIGPMIPSYYLLKDQSSSSTADKTYGADLFCSDDQNNLCMSWLDKQPANSVIYISFGSLSKLSQKQTEELAFALRQTDYPFLWVVRKSEYRIEHETLMKQSHNDGIIVHWCSQLEVLAHEAVGCFITHCGWNSVLESISLQKPMVAMPQWTDQPTNAKYVEDVWGVGIRARVSESEGVVVRDEIVRCIELVMEGEVSERVRKNVANWSCVVRSAITDHAHESSSTKNIDDFALALLK